MRYLLPILLLLLACASDPWEERDRQRERDHQRNIATTKSKTLTEVKSEETTYSTYSDILVWRLCSSAIEGNVQPEPLQVIYGLDESGLSKDKDYSMRVVKLARTMMDSWPNTNANLVEEIYNTCQDWRKMDGERFKSK